MAGQEELEIEIGPRGEVEVKVKGAGGTKCLDYVEIFRALLSGEVKEQQLTAEYYQTEAQTDARQRLRGMLDP